MKPIAVCIILFIQIVWKKVLKKTKGMREGEIEEWGGEKERENDGRRERERERELDTYR